MVTAGSTKGDVLLQAVAEVARRAGKVALSHFRSRLSVETKHDGSPVTVADRAAEEAAREWITARFPGDGIHGEEFGIENAQARRRWWAWPSASPASTSGRRARTTWTSPPGACTS